MAMIRWPKLLIFSVLPLAFGAAILLANSSDRAKAIDEELVEVTAFSPENEGKLVIVSGTPQLVDGGVLTDEEAGLRVENATSYSRVPYQKIYKKGKREVVVDKGEDKFSEVDDVKETEYYISTTWVNADSTRDEVVTLGFQRYENPGAVKLPAYHASGDLRVSGFKVIPSDVYDYISMVNRGFTADELAQACGQYITRSEIGLRAVTDEDGDGMLSNGDEVGCVHVLFSYTTLEDAKEVTLVGRQRGEELVVEDDELVSSAEHVLAGKVSKEEFLDAITAEDTTSRKYGIGCLVVGVICLVLSFDLRRG